MVYQGNLLSKTLVIGTIFLFTVTSIIPSVAIDTVKKPIIPTSKGDILYVGGTGEGNYTKIQDAVNDASNGDTVYVFDDSSPYEENIVINNPISLIGENKETTVIDGMGYGDTIYVISDWVKIRGFTIQNREGEWDDDGIQIYSNHTIIIDNIIRLKNDDGGAGVYLGEGSNNNIITSNNITGISHYGNGILLYPSSGNIITDNIISNNYDGIMLLLSDGNIIVGNNISNNLEYGINLYISSNNTIKDNNVSNNFYGIDLSFYCDNNTITSNIISKNDGGINLFRSSNNTITSNLFFYGGLFVWDSYNNTVENNTVNGKPLVYLTNKSNYIIKEAGQVILINCDNITIENLYLSNTYAGIELWSTNNSIIHNNTCSSNDFCGISLGSYCNNNTIMDNNINLNNWGGLYLDLFCQNNIITGNTISFNNLYYGISLGLSSNNNITNNNIFNNYFGIDLDWHSNSNRITDNTISNNLIGVKLEFSDNNIIYHNNFIDNSNNSYDKGNNIWDDGKYGNYWSDYKERYPDAKRIWLKGIWDTPYNISGGNNKDNCPLINQWPISKPRTITRNKSFNSNFNLLSWLFDRFPFLERLLFLVKIC